MYGETSIKAIFLVHFTLAISIYKYIETSLEILINNFDNLLIVSNNNAQFHLISSQIHANPQILGSICTHCFL